MKIGDLVVIPDEDHPRWHGKPAYGIVMDTPTEGSRTGILWPDGDGQIDYEPTEWLKVICESR